MLTIAINLNPPLFAKEAIEKFYGAEAKRKDCLANVMYGDTDSLFVEFNVRNPETGKQIKLATALRHDKNSPVHRAAAIMIRQAKK